MYCTRADIEQKRLARQNLLQLVDDEGLDEFDDSTGATPPVGNTLPLYSDLTTSVNIRVLDSIEDACNEIDAYLTGVYIVPITVETPAIVTTIAVNIATYYLYIRRGNQIPDGIQALYDNAVSMLKQIAARRMSLPIPKATDDNVTTQSAFALRTRPKALDNLAF